MTTDRLPSLALLFIHQSYVTRSLCNGFLVDAKTIDPERAVHAEISYLANCAATAMKEDTLSLQRQAWFETCRTDVLV
jgi:hypothetical protein